MASYASKALTGAKWLTIGAITWKIGSTLLEMASSKHTCGKSKHKPTDSRFSRFIVSNETGLWLYWHEWAAVEPASVKGVVYVCHGFGEHIQRYEHVAAALNAAGYVVYGIDHQGHGQSEGDRAYVEKFEHYVLDFIQFVKESDGRYPGAPRFILGHSMGGTIAIEVVKASPSLWKGCVLSGPGLKPDPAVANPASIFMANTLSSILPKLTFDRLDASKVSSDELVVEQYKRDPLVYHGMLKIRWAAEVLRTMNTIQKEAASFTHPFLIVHGEEDQLCLPEGSKEFFKASKSVDKTLNFYPKMKHEVMGEVGRDEVIGSIIEWLDSHSK